MARAVDGRDLPLNPAALEAVRAAGGEIVVESRWLNAVSVRATGIDLDRIAHLPYVKRVAPVSGGTRVEPDAPEITTSFGFESTPRRAPLIDYGLSHGQLAQIGIPEAHFAGYDGEGVVIAVFDTGFEYIHPAFAKVLVEGRLLGQRDFVNDDDNVMNEAEDHPNQHDHGTKVWSTIAGYVPGVLIGSAFQASFLLAKTEDLESESPIEEDYWVAAAEWADLNGADVISSSLTYVDWYSYEDMDGDTAPITRAADIAAQRGIVVCIAAGNLGSSSWYHIGAPADADSIITIGAVDEQNRVADFSGRGPSFDGRIKPEVVARGVSTYTAMPLSSGLEFWWNSGTSFSCPLVAGAVALILEANSDWSPAKVREALLTSADHAFDPNNDRGWGLVDTWAALNTPVSVTGFAGSGGGLRAFPNPAHDRISFSAERSPAVDPVEIYAADGTRIRILDLVDGAGTWMLRSERGRRVAPGVYFARLAGDPASAIKLVVR